MMNPIFLGWKEPVIGHTAKWLLANFEDLSDVKVVVRGSRAGRLLLEKLAVESEKIKRPLFLPKIATIARVVEDLFEPPDGALPAASDLVQMLAWMEALRRLPSAEKSKLFVLPEGVGPGGEPELLLAKRLQSLWKELGGEGISFSDVGRLMNEKLSDAPDSDVERWGLFDQVHGEYRNLLKEMRWIDPAERRVLFLEKGKVKDVQVVLAGVVEILPVFQKMLEALPRPPRILVFAPETEKEGFDEYGRLNIKYWAKRSSGLSEGQIHPVVRAGDQATLLAEMAKKWSGATLSIPEESAVAGIREALREEGMESHWAEGKKMSEGRVATFLQAVVDYVSRRRGEAPSWQSAALLMRHPDGLGNQLKASEDLDEYAEEHVPEKMDAPTGSDAGKWTVQLEERIGLEPLLESASKQATRVSQLLMQIYGSMEVHADLPSGRMMRDSLQKARKVMAELDSLKLPYLEKIETADYLRLVLSEMEGSQVPEPARSGAVEMVGWLELAEEDSPSVAVASFHEGAVPSSVTSDEFLPGHLREILGVNDNDRRLARDAYALAVILGTRQEGRGIVGLVVPSFNSAGDPVKPSRLLLGGLQGRDLAARVLALTEQADKKEKLEVLGSGRGFGALPAGHEKIDRVSVTAFRTYLMSPRYFYFSRVLRLGEVLDEPGELSATGFGTLIHRVAGAFAREVRVRESTREDEIFAFVRSELHRLAEKTFGKEPKAAVGWQLELAEERLQTFARVQAQERAEGWKIILAEDESQKKKNAEHRIVDLQGRGLTVYGRPDRIDRNEKTGRWRIVDIKTSATPKDPERAHQQANGTWKDLQMPLYRELAPAVLGGEGKDWDPEKCDLVYFQLPKDLEEAGISEPMDQSTVLEALEKAREVAGFILDGKWDEIGELDPETIHPTFLALCGLAGIPQSVPEEEGEE